MAVGGGAPDLAPTAVEESGLTVVCLTDEIVERQLRRHGTVAPLLFKAFTDQLEEARLRRTAQLEQATATLEEGRQGACLGGDSR